jgi:glycosyltransferase involved in cell wall biosynthesis
VTEEFFSLVGEEQESDLGLFSRDELSASAKGGTEMMCDLLEKHVDPELLSKVFIIPTRVRSLHPDKPNILWVTDLWDDPECAHLADPASRERFAKIVFVSHYQFNTFHERLGVPYSQSHVLWNAIDPIEEHEKPNDRINLIYHTTPHRGLQILVPVFQRLYEIFGDKIHLDVYSSFDIYGWPERNAPYEPLFEMCRNHPGISYHGFVPNSEVREALKKAHIFAFPSIWRETSCVAAIEAVSAGCTVVCPSLGALPETCGPFQVLYPYSEDMNEHAILFASSLYDTISVFLNEPEVNLQMTRYAKHYTDLFYGWQVRKQQWEVFLRKILSNATQAPGI